MRHLYLMRHAKAKQPSGDMPDHERPLSQRGKRQAAAMAHVLLRWQALEGEIYVSSAARTRETFDQLAEQLPEHNLANQVHVDEGLYTFEGNALLAWLTALPNEASRVLIIGHNPALPELARWLNKQVPYSLPTAGLLHFTLPDTPWSGVEPGSAEWLGRLTPEEASYPLFQRLAPKLPSQGDTETASRIYNALAHQYLMIRALEPGVIAGDDPEFLHQYRVNLRRSRAIGESVHSITKVPSLKQMLKRLKRRAQATSELRDLDVLLNHLSETPPPLCAGTRKGLQQWLLRCQRVQHQTLCQQISAPVYAEEMQGWQAFIAADDVGKALAKLTPKRIKAVLAERIARHNDELAALSLDSPDTAFHELRKRVKRIRYVADLNPASPQRLLSDLKCRQRLLGDYQDVCTRQTWVEAFIASPDIESDQKQECETWRNALEAQKQRLREDVIALAPLKVRF